MQNPKPLFGTRWSIPLVVLGLMPILSLAQPAAGIMKVSPNVIPSGTTKPKIEEQSLAATVGELLKRDAAEALNPRVVKDISVVALPPVVPVIKGHAPYLTSVFGMEGARVIRLKLSDQPILTYVENTRDVDKREPSWRLLAVEGKCAYFENTALDKSKVRTSKSLQEKICYGKVPPPASLPLTLAIPASTSSRQELPSIENR